MNSFLNNIQQQYDFIRFQTSVISAKQKTHSEAFKNLYSKDNPDPLLTENYFQDTTMNKEFLLKVSDEINSFLNDLTYDIHQNSINRYNSLYGRYDYQQLSEASFNDFMSKSRQLQSIKDSVAAQKNEWFKKKAKLVKKIDDLASGSQDKKKKVKSSSVHKALKKLLKIRNSGVNHEETVKAALHCSQAIISGVSQMQNNLETVLMLLDQLYTLKMDANYNVMNRISSLSSTINATVQTHYFENDFCDLILQKRLIRYDIIPEPFVPVDFNHPVFSEMQISCVMEVPSLEIYPIAIAKAIHSFTPEYSNEISVSKGKFVYLLEDLSNEWVFIQNPYTRTRGYAPSSHFEIVSLSTGVILHESDSGGVLLKRGDYVSLFESSQSNSFFDVLTITNQIACIGKDKVAIINSFQ